jgi:glycine/D-amino acid oxidase-like deaminating enzyme
VEVAEIVICGGSVIGLSTAMLLAGEGHEVTVLEADPTAVPDDPASAWGRSDRHGVAQFHQPHNLFARARQVMDDDLSGLTDALLEAGGIIIDPMAALPPTIADFSREADDDRLRFANDRRRLAEMAVLARGETPEAPDPMLAAVGAAMAHDAAVFRGIIEVINCLAFAADVFRRPDFHERVAPFVGQAPTPLPGPDREALVACLR